MGKLVGVKSSFSIKRLCNSSVCLPVLPVCSLCAISLYNMSQSVKTKIVFEGSSNQ